MAASIAYGKQVPTAYSATSSQAGFGPDNLGVEALTRPWRAVDATEHHLIITFASALPVHTILLHDVNFASAAIHKSADGVAYSLAGSLLSYQGREGRRRGALVVNDASVKALKVVIAAGTPTDGLTWWRIGTAYPFSAQLAAAAPFQFPYAARFRYPQVRADIPNGQAAVANTGPGFHLVEVPWRPFDTEDLEPVVRRARAATVLLNLGMANYPEQLWPVRLDEPEMVESFAAPRTADLKLTFREVV